VPAALSEMHRALAQAAGCWCGTSIGPPCPGTRSIGS
jgi:hypothetical protein